MIKREAHCMADDVFVSYANIDKLIADADLAGSEAITKVHLAKALQYRPKLDLI